MAAALSLSACRFDSGSTGDLPTPIDETSPADDPVRVSCTADGILACYQFENTLRDESGHGNDGLVVAGHVEFVAGVTGRALRVERDAEIDVTPGMSLSTGSVSIETFVYLDDLRTRSRSGVIDHQNEWAMSIAADGRPYCSFNTVGKGEQVVMSPNSVPLATWTHLACTFDAAAGEAMIYVNGYVEMYWPFLPTPLVVSGDQTALAGNAPSGDSLVGRLDMLRVWSYARQSQEIEAAIRGE
jgi:hypothetical protein